MVFGALGIIRPFTETSPDIHLLTYYSLPKTALKLQKKKQNNNIQQLTLFPPNYIWNLKKATPIHILNGQVLVKGGVGTDPASSEDIVTISELYNLFVELKGVTLHHHFQLYCFCTPQWSIIPLCNQPLAPQKKKG